MDKQLFAKLINGELEIAPHHYQDNDTYIMNFDECEELMYQFGYKPVIGERPDYNHNTQEVIITYKEEKNCIRKYYEIIEKITPQFEVNNIDEEINNLDDEKYNELIKENSELRKRLEELKSQGYETYAPELKYCTDNAAMVASCAYFNPIKSKDSLLLEVFSRG